jgi:putative DNA primase/helicase
MPNSYLGKEDRDLQGRLLAEMSGILKWAIEGRKRLDAAGKITQPTSGYSLLNELQTLLSPVSMFLGDRCNVKSEGEISTRELFAHWEVWCEENDISHPGDVQSFARKLNALLPGLSIRQKRSPSGERFRYYIGIDVKDEQPLF